MKHKGMLIVISGFSGAGKGTLVKKLLNTYDQFGLSISMTTRAPRQGEVHGREYFFVTKEDFEDTIAHDGLIEYANYCGNYYGTPRAYVEQEMEKGRDVMLEIEIQGALQIKKKFPESLLLFVTPPSAAELEKRLVGRGTETPEVIAKRLARATEESKGVEAYDYIVVNDDLDQCVEDVHGLVEAARMTPLRQEEFLSQIQGELKKFQKVEEK